MSTRSIALKKCFQKASELAIHAELGHDWMAVDHSPESWIVRYQRSTKVATQVIQLRLAEKHHIIELVLAIKRAPHGPMPSIWWDDRANYPAETGYRKVLWTGTAYNSEESIAVPREIGSADLAKSIKDKLALLRPAIEAWYGEAELRLLRRLA